MNTTAALFSQGPIDGVIQELDGEPITHSVFTPNKGEGSLSPKVNEHIYDRSDIKCGNLTIYIYRK